MRELLDQVSQALASSPSSPHELSLLKARLLGKNGLLSHESKSLRDLPQEKRAEKEQKLRELRASLEKKIAALEKEMKSRELEGLERVGLPSGRKVGSLNPICSAIQDLSRTLEGMGFLQIAGPEVERVENNFDRLNVRPDHPSRSANDTFYLDSSRLLRTQTTTTLINRLTGLKAPFKAYSIGPVYRNDEEDATHTSMFHQLDLAVMSEKGEQFSLGHLKGLIDELVRVLYEVEKWKFVPSFFPFTEPSGEVYVGPHEVLGAGLLHKKVLERIGFQDHSCLALGMGIERIVAIKKGMNNIRDFYSLETREEFVSNPRRRKK